MNALVTLAVFALGAGALALWLDVRFPGLAPETKRGILLRIGLCFLVGQFAVPSGMHALVSQGSPVLTLLGICLVALPGLVYCLLTAIWVIKALRDDPRRLVR